MPPIAGNSETVSVTLAPASRYLPVEKFGAVEQVLADRKSIVGRIYQEEEFHAAQIYPFVLFAYQWGDTALAIASQILEYDFPIFYCLVRSDAQNAMAIRFADWACIVLSDALSRKVFYLTNELARSKYFVGYRSIHLFNWRIRRLPRVSRREMIDRLPKSEEINVEQWHFTTIMNGVALLFVIYHEIAHIVNGHLKPNSEEMTITEVERETGIRDLSTLQALEYDADALAAALTIEHLLSASETYPEEFLLNQLDVIHTATAGMCLAMCAIEAMRNVEIAEAEKQIHAPATFRLLDTYSVARKAVQGSRATTTKPSRETIEFIQRRVAKTVERAIADRAGCQGEIKHTDRFQARYKEHVLSVLKRWAQIRPSLLERSIGRATLAPAQFNERGERLP